MCHRSFFSVVVYVLSLFSYLLAMVEDDGAVWPAVVVNQAQIWEKTNSHRLKTPLVAHREAVTIDLEHSTCRVIGSNLKIWKEFSFLN